MRRVYIITGANGHLGNTLIRMLKGTQSMIRGLLLPTEHREERENVRYFHGDVREPETLRPLFEGLSDAEVFVIHTAGIIDIGGTVSPQMYAVNVEGTRNIVTLCQEYPVKRLVYVSSVHAIPEQRWRVQKEVQRFSPEEVVGGYAKTKAEATQLVLDAARAGLDAVVVHPSGIIGPYDRSGNHLVQMITDYIRGKLPACVRGGYDLVDVRDVAAGCIAAAEKGRKGECYILSNRHYEIREVLGMAREYGGGRSLPTLPIWMAKAAAPVLEWTAKRRHRRPLYTRYSLYTLHSNDKFSHEKASRELGYHPRDLARTVRDTIRWEKRKTANSMP